MRRPYVLSSLGCAALVAAAFLPWLRLGDVGLSGVPDPAGFFVVGLGALGLLLALAGMSTRRNTQPGLMLTGLAALTTLVVVWLTGPATIAERALARAQAVALVDNVAMQPPPPVTLGVGLILGLAGAATVACVGVISLWSGRER